MQIDVGYFYFVKDDFFDIINDPELMKNKENGIKRPCYFCFKSKENEIISKANKVLNLYNHGMKNIIFPDIDNILKQLLS